MPSLVACVPNFSEGQDRKLVEEIAAAGESASGIRVLDLELDSEQHRSVLTFAGDPDSMVEAILRAARVAVKRIDLKQHRGQHPRIGAIDVVPFVPIESISLEGCVALARELGERIASELEVPVFLYEHAATRPARKNIADIRQGQFEKLRERIGEDPDWAPDFGPKKIHPTAGAVAVGARRPLISFNANLATPELEIAESIARAVSFAGGGLKNVRATGSAIRDGRQTRVSAYLCDTEETPVHRVLALIDHEAKRWGTLVTGCELAGLVPRSVLLDSAEQALRLENFRRDQILEVRLDRREGAGSGG
jgi:glutamate formiminotransferase